MTEEREIDRSKWTVQVTAPGVKYSAITVAFSQEAVAEAILMCKFIAQQWAEAGLPIDRDSAPRLTQEPTREPVNDGHPNAPGNDYGPPLAAQRPPQTNGNGKGSGLFCPEHTRIELVETIAKYQTYDTIDGQQVPAKYFCPGDKNGTGANHSVWRSKALMPEPVPF